MLTLEDGVETSIVVEHNTTEFDSVDTPWGKKYEIPITYPYIGTFRTGSKWLVVELTKHLQNKCMGFTLLREGFKIKYKTD